MARRRALSLPEWLCLGLLVEQPRHGYELAAALAPGTELGDVWTVRRDAVYRALDRLADLGYVETDRTEAGDGAPPRTVYRVTADGASAVDAWLERPVEHLREVRGAFLAKLVLARRLDRPAEVLVAAQRERFAPVFAALTAAGAAAPGDPVEQWRAAAARSVADFLSSLR